MSNYELIVNYETVYLAVRIMTVICELLNIEYRISNVECRMSNVEGSVRIGMIPANFDIRYSIFDIHNSGFANIYRQYHGVMNRP